MQYYHIVFINYFQGIEVYIFKINILEFVSAGLRRKESFMKFFRKNKLVVLVASVIIVSLAYFGVQKAIDNYSFKKNEDIVSEEEDVDSLEEGGERKGASEEEEKISSEETDLVLEGDPEADSDDGEDASLAEEQTGVKSPGPEENEETQNKIYVYITGEVNYPGVLILNEGSRIVDAINAAGGTTAKADISKVNLVYVLEDGMKVNIPNSSDLKNKSDFEYITMNSGDGGNDNDSGKSPSGEGSSSNSSESKRSSIVNINTATQTELETLPGIRAFYSFKYY